MFVSWRYTEDVHKSSGGYRSVAETLPEMLKALVQSQHHSGKDSAGQSRALSRQL